MKSVYGRVADVVRDNIRDTESLFVFSTDVICESWIDWAAKNADESGVRAFNLDEFITWDRFKAEFLADDAGDLVCVPPVMRRVFVQDLLARNNDEHFLRRIVNSAEKYRECAFGFTDWIAKILPSLAAWRERIARYPRPLDDEDADYMTLYERYTAFLRDNGLYEPAYQSEKFRDSVVRRRIFILYPEIIEDFSDFEDAFARADNITAVRIDAGAAPRPACDVFDDARSELRFLALRLRRLQEAGCDLRRVGVSVPDLETVRPYLERELSRYAVPYVVRAGTPYTSSGGSIFVKIRDCISQNFSFDSVRALLLDGSVPWRDAEQNESLVREGSERRCVCAYEDEGRLVDPWEESLPEGALKARYLKLHAAVRRFGSAQTFAALRTAWNAFRADFIDEEAFADESGRYSLTDKVLGRVVSDMGELVDVEREYIAPHGMELSSCFDFFINELRSSTYTPDARKYGVNIFPYGVASYADFDYQFVINASQDALSLLYKRLSFITNIEKRAALKLDEAPIFGGGTQEASPADASTVTAALYAKQERAAREKQCCFSFAKKSFAGAAIMHTSLEEKKMSGDERRALEEYDFLKRERGAFLEGDADAAREISAVQKGAFGAWRARAAEGSASSLSDGLKARVDASLRRKGGSGTDAVKVSQTELNNAFPCPRKFLLRNVIGLEEDTLDTSLTKSYEAGTFMHRIIEITFDEFAKRFAGRVPVWGEQNKNEIRRIVEDAFDKARDEGRMEALHSCLALKAIESQKPLFCDGIAQFLEQFCGEGGKGFGGYRIAGLECTREIASKSGAFNFFGRVDCVLSGEDGALTIVDYKSGSLPKAADCIYDIASVPPLSNFQMATYVKLLEDGEHKVGAAVFCAVRPDNDGKFARSVVIGGKKTREDFEDTEDALEDYGARFAADCAAYDFAPVSSLKDKQRGVNIFTDCASCAFGGVCRTPFNVAKREL